MLQRQTNLQEEIIFDIDENGLEIKSEAAKSELKWKFIMKAIITEKVILLYPNMVLFYMLPERFFDESEYEKLKQLVEEKVDNIKHYPK
jgi:hypothetical protein